MHRCGPPLRLCYRPGYLGHLAGLGPLPACFLYGFIVLPRGRHLWGFQGTQLFPHPGSSHFDP